VDAPSPLFAAVAEGDVKAALALLDAGEDPNPFDAEGLTPLMRAAQAGDEALVLALLDGGADPGITDALGESAYVKAAAHGQPGVCAQLGRFASRDEREMAEALLRAGPERMLAPPAPPQQEQDAEAPGTLRRGLASASAALSDLLGDGAPAARLERAKRAKKKP
jgi:ankyrin repeat protein